MAARIFINYRRGDDPGFTHALYQRLEDEFTADSIFMDVEGHIRPGDDFVEVLNAQVAAADILLVVIGPRWAELLAARAGDPEDFVTIEIEAGLSRGKRVIPVLVGGAAMPRPDSLPAAITPLARRNAVGLRPERFRADCQGLVSALKEQLAAAQAERIARSEAERAAADAARRRAENEAALRAAEAEQRAKAQAVAGLTPEEIRKAEELVNWQFVESRGDVAELRDHLARFPGGATERYALAKLEALAWENVGRSTDIDALRAFVDEFQNGANVEAARARIADLARKAAARKEENEPRNLHRPIAPHSLGLLAGLAVLFILGALIQQPYTSFRESGSLGLSSTAWVALSSVLSLVTIPGIALFYAGLLHAGNVQSALKPVIWITALAGVVWIVAGYSLTWTEGGALNAFVGGLSKVLLAGVSASSEVETFTQHVHVSEFAFIVYMMSVMCVAVALVGGAFARSMRLPALLFFAVLWITFVHIPVTHMIWYWSGPDALVEAARKLAAASGDAKTQAELALATATENAGLLFRWGALDFAGGAVIFIVAGVSGIVGELMTDRRAGSETGDMSVGARRVTSVGAAAMGLGLVGVVAGGSLEATGLAVIVVLNLAAAAAAGALGWMVADLWAKGRVVWHSPLWGALSGSAAIVPASGFAGLMGSLVLGAVAAVACFALVAICRGSERVNVLLVYSLAGILGMLGTGVVVSPELGGTGVFDYTIQRVGDYDLTSQVWAQVKSICLVVIWSAAVSALIFAVVKAVFGPKAGEAPGT